MNLIAPEFRGGEIAGHNNGAARAVYLDHVLPALGLGNREELFEHFEDILGRMIVVIEQHDVIERRELVGDAYAQWSLESGAWLAACFCSYDSDGGPGFNSQVLSLKQKGAQRIRRD